MRRRFKTLNRHPETNGAYHHSANQHKNPGDQSSLANHQTFFLGWNQTKKNQNHQSHFRQNHPKTPKMRKCEDASSGVFASSSVFGVSWRLFCPLLPMTLTTMYDCCCSYEFLFIPIHSFSFPLIPPLYYLFFLSILLLVIH